MKLPELSEVQFQSAARSQEFDPLQLPDPNPSLSQNLSIIQQSFANMAQSGKMNAEALYRSDPQKQEYSFTDRLGQLSELLPKAMQTLSQAQEIDVAIQMARADDQYYQMLEQGLIPPNGEILAIEQNEKDKKLIIDGAAADAAKVTNSYDIPRGILNFSNHGEIALKRKLAKHMFTNVYPDWMTTQLETNTSTIMVEDGQGGMVEVRINDSELPDFQFKQVMSHLRTAFMGHETLANTNNDLIQKEMAIGFTTDAKLQREHTRTYRAADGKRRFTSEFNTMWEEFGNGNLMALAEMKKAAESMPDEKGIGYTDTNLAFFDRLRKAVKTTAANGAEFNLGEFLTKATFEDGQTMMQRAPAQARIMMREYRDARRKYLGNKRKADTEDLKFGVTSFISDCQESGQCTTADYVEFNQMLALKGGEIGVSVSELQGLVSQSMRLSSVEGEDLNEYRKQVDIALATGQATSKMEAMQNPTIRAEYGEKVAKQEERTQSDEYKFSSGQIEAAIKGTHSSLVDPQGQMKFMTRGANAHYQRVYDQEFARIKDTNAQRPEGQKLTDLAIAKQAEEFVLSQWNKDKVDPAHDYYVDPKNGNMPNYPQPEEAKADQAVRANVNTLATEAKTQSGILNAVVANPALMYNSEEAAAAVQLFQTTGRIDPNLEYKAKLINEQVGKVVITNPIQLALAAAVGHGHLKPEDLKSVQPPAVVRRLNARGRRQYMRDLLQLGGSTYTNLAKYRPAGPGSAMPVRGSMAGSVQTTSPGVRGLGELVRSGEGGYNSMFPSEEYPDLTNMVINTELVNFQRQKLGDGRASAAVGAYQFLEPEVAAARAGLPPDAKFTPENQDRMFLATLLTKPGREAIAQYLQGSSNNVELAIDQLAMEFASIEYRNGRSYYQDGVNKASVTRARAAAALLSAREEMMRSRAE